MVSINTNLTDMIIMSSLNDSTNGINKSIERLTSGYKINHAKDNAANLNIVTNLSTKISSLLQVRNNTEDGISLLSTAQGGLEEISNLLKRLRNLSTQAMNGTYGEQSLSAMQAEADEIIEQINRIRETTEFNGMKLFYTPSAEADIGTAAVNSLNRAQVKINGKTISRTTEQDISTKQIQTIPSGQEDTTSVRNLSLRAEKSTSASQSSPAPRAGDISGAVDIAGNGSKEILIDGVSYIVENLTTTSQSFSYSKDTSTGVVTLYGSNFKITGQDGVSHNLIVSGNHNEVHGGDMDDTIRTGTSGTNNELYGEGGNDTLEVNVRTSKLYGGAGNDVLIDNAYDCYLYGDEGDDTIYLDFPRGISYVYGGAGNDTFHIERSEASRIYGESGDDAFYVGQKASGVVINGGEGTNTLDDKGVNTVAGNVVGSRSMVIDFNGYEKKNVVINNITIRMICFNRSERTISICL